MNRCPGLHCPGCGHEGVLGALAAVAAAAVAYEIVAALLWAIVATVATALVIGTAAAVVIARRMNRPVQLTRYRNPAELTQESLLGISGTKNSTAELTQENSRGISDGNRAAYAELEARLRDAEINARAALLAAGIIAQHTRPLPASGPLSSTERVISG